MRGWVHRSCSFGRGSCTDFPMLHAASFAASGLLSTRHSWQRAALPAPVLTQRRILLLLLQARMAAQMPTLRRGRASQSQQASSLRQTAPRSSAPLAAAASCPAAAPLATQPSRLHRARRPVLHPLHRQHPRRSCMRSRQRPLSDAHACTCALRAYAACCDHIELPPNSLHLSVGAFAFFLFSHSFERPPLFF